MPNYHFHLDECGSRTMDVEGSEHRDLAAARAFAILTARELMCEELRSGELCLNCHIDIVDDHGRQLARVYFLDAVHVRGPTTASPP